MRKILPFLYVRNWYNGQFEFKSDRALAFALTVGILCVLAAIALWMGRPIEYVQPQ